MNPIDEKDKIIHSQEVHEIMTQPPSWFIRWGSLAMLMTILFLFLLSWILRYPDVLNAKVVITTSPPPIPMVARASGYLRLLKLEGDSVNEGELIGYIQSAANIDEVLKLSRELSSGSAPSGSSNELGILSTDLATLLTQLSEWEALHSEKESEARLQQLAQRQKTLEELQNVYINQNIIAENEALLAKQKFLTDSVLFSQNVISQVDFSQSKATWLQQLRNSKNFASIMLTNKIQANDVQREMTTVRREQATQERTLSTSIKTTRATLLAKVKEWKETYLITSQNSGTIALSGIVENGMFVNAGRELGFIFTTKTLIAKALLPVQGSGKVRVSQKVNLRLDNYPAEQFGVVHGVVTSISMLPKEQNYLLTIQITDGLRTSQNVHLTFEHELSGNANILTDDARLFERFIHKFRDLLQRN